MPYRDYSDELKVEYTSHLTILSQQQAFPPGMATQSYKNFKTTLTFWGRDFVGEIKLVLKIIPDSSMD